MESLNCSHVSSNIIPSEDERDASPSRKHPKTKQKRKASVVSVRNGEKTKTSRASKNKQSSVQIRQEMSDAPKLMTKDNLQSVDNDHLSTPKCVQHEHDDKSPEDTLNLMQMTLEERDITQPIPKNESTGLPEDVSIQDGVKLINEIIIEEQPSTTKEEEQKNVDLEEKLDQDNELDIANTMDLSSSKITDNDIPMIVQQILRKGKKQCTNLVLRDNALTSIGIKILVEELLKASVSLRSLGLSSNPGIGDAGVEHLIHLLQGSRSITLLALHNTGITDRGVHLLADVLCDTNTSSLSSLEKLYISFNKSITDRSLRALMQILEHNQTLKVLALQHCSLSDRARRRLRQMGAKKKKKKFSLSE